VSAAFFRTDLVDLVGPFGSVGQNQDLVASDLQEAAANGHRFFGATFFDANNPRLQRREQRSMARQDAYNAFSARGDNHVDSLFGVDFSFSSDDLDTQRHQVFGKQDTSKRTASGSHRAKQQPNGRREYTA
jgi:hypothetical protein